MDGRMHPYRRTRLVAPPGDDAEADLPLPRAAPNPNPVLVPSVQTAAFEPATLPNEQEYGRGLVYVDQPDARMRIPNPNGQPGETVSLEGRYKIRYLTDLINFVKKRMNTTFYVWLTIVAGESGLSKIFKNMNGTDLKAVGEYALKSLEGDLALAKRNADQISLARSTRRAHMFGAANGVTEDISADTQRRLDLAFSTGGVPESSVPAVNAGQLLTDLPRYDLSRLPPALMGAADVGVPPIDFSSEEAATRYFISIGRYTKDVKEGLKVLWPATPPEELSLSFLMSSEISLFESLNPIIVSKVAGCIDWIAREFTYWKIVAPYNIRKEMEFINRYTTSHALYIGLMCQAKISTKVPMDNAPRGEQSENLYVAKCNFISDVSGRVREVPFIGTYQHLRRLNDKRILPYQG